MGAMSLEKSVDSPTNKGLENGYTNLATAIIAKAADDYKTAYYSHNVSSCVQIRKFFTNSWLADAFKIDLVSILERIERDMNENVDKK